jgi:CDP-diacylglycerol--glycerol-3-phosphate 3-phosphatidyltransferase
MRGLYALKPWYSRRLMTITRVAVSRDVSPDMFTAGGVVAAAFGAVAIWHGWWIPALVLLAARLGGANLDGAVARAREVGSARGFIVNELGDRASDLLMFAGLAALAARTGAPDSRAWLVAGVVGTSLAATLPTFVSLCAVGCGASRANGGPLGKTERCALAVVMTAVPAVLAAGCALIALGSVLTAAMRLCQALDELAQTVPAEHRIAP